MSKKTVEERVTDIIVQELGVTPMQVTPEAKFIEDLGVTQSLLREFPILNRLLSRPGPSRADGVPVCDE
jgi:hypothetical protein